MIHSNNELGCAKNNKKGTKKQQRDTLRHVSGANQHIFTVKNKFCVKGVSRDSFLLFLKETVLISVFFGQVVKNSNVSVAGNLSVLGNFLKTGPESAALMTLVLLRISLCASGGQVHSHKVNIYNTLNRWE